MKPLKSVAHNVCHQFASTLNYWGDDYGINHFARAVRAAGGHVTVDLLTASSSPALSGLGQNLARHMAGYLPELLQKEGFAPDLLISAIAKYDFLTTRKDPSGSVAYDCQVQLATQDGRSYSVAISEQNTP